MTFETYDNVTSGEIKEYYPHEIKKKKYPKGSRVLIIDGDILTYKLATFGDERVCIVTNPEGKQREYKNRTAFKKLRKEQGKSVEGYTYEDILKPHPIEYCLASLRGAIKNVKERVGADYVEIYIGGSENFRLNLPLPTVYKSGRKELLRPTYLTDCKEYMLKYHNAVKVKGVEADDYVQQRMYELYQDGVDGVLYSNDKDARQAYQFPITIYNPDKDDIQTHKDGLGELWLAPNGDLKGSGLKWLINQTLAGDSSDSYKGNELSGVRYGEKTYYNDVNGFTTIEELLNYAVGKWKEWYPTPVTYQLADGFEVTRDWLKLAEMYWSCAYMRISDYDKTTFKSLLKEYDVDY